MPSPIEALQAGGFSTEEIGAWATERRATLAGAGFKENEIDAYFADSVVAPDKVPDSFVRRMVEGAGLSKAVQALPEAITDVPNEMWRTTLEATNGIVDKLVPKSLGGGRDPSKEGAGEGLAKTGLGLLDIVALPLAPIQGALRSLVGHPLVTVDNKLRDGAVGIYGEETVSRAEKEAGLKPGGMTYEEARGKVDTALMAVGSRKINRVTMGPNGPEVVEIGGLPTGTDFRDAARTVAGPDAPRAVQEKLLKSYEEKGLHPAEVAADAATDPIVAQRLLSSDTGVSPLSGVPMDADALRNLRAKGESDYQLSPAAMMEPEPYHQFTRMAQDLPDEANASFQVHGLLAGNRDSNLLYLLRSGIDADREFHAGPPRPGSHGVDSTRTFGSPYLLISDKGKSLPETGVKNVVAVGPAEATIPALRREFPEVNFMTVDQAEKFMRGGGGGGKPPNKPPSERPSDDSFDGAQRKILDKISVGESGKRETGLSWSKFYRHAVDDLHPLKGVDEDAYTLARLTRGQFGKAEHFLEHGTFEFGTLKNNGKPLAEILKPVRDDLDGVRAYLASKRGLEIEASGRKSGMDLEAAQRVVTEGGAKYEKIAQEIFTYQENTLKYLRDSGVISEEAFTAMREANANYVPFYRVFAAEDAKGFGKSFGPSNPLKRLKGSERDIIDPLESIIKNTYAYVSVAERNAVGIKIVDALKKENYPVETHRPRRETKADKEVLDYLSDQGIRNPEHLLDFMKAQDGETISAFRNGRKESVAINDPELVAAFRSLDEGSANMLVKVLAVPARALRAGAVLSPDFITRNIVRDFMTAFVNSKGVFSPIDTARGLKSVIRKDSDFLDWMKGGGANSTMVALDRAYMQESLTKLAGETGLMDRSWNVVKSPLTGLRMISELAENATRLGEFKKVRAQGGSITEAAFASREVTLDFARIGASMRAYNMITAFGNAQIQGLDRVGRAFADRPINTTAKVAAGITLPSVLLWYANKDDPRYKELLHWERDLFWHVMTKDHIYRIPKPFELGVVFGSGAERILDATVGADPEAFAKFEKTIIDIITPGVIPTGVQPIVEQFANRSTFTDRTLIPADMEKHLPEYQYTPYTTELSKALGQVISAIPGVRNQAVGPGQPFGPLARTVTSPILLENYVRSWTGGLGNYIMQTADYGLRKAGVLPDPVTPTPTLADIPFVRAFVVRYPSATTQSVQDFYDKHEVSTKYFNTWQARAKEGDAEAMQRIQDAGGPMMFVRLDAIRSVLGDHSKLIRDVYKNPDIPADEKRQMIDGLYYNMIEVAKGGKAMFAEGEKAFTAP